ncbi:MAG: hypothetical protein ACXAC8_17180 [Candidatus Hodarchaeales archaeon]
MKGSQKMGVYVGTFIFVIVGYIVSLIVSDILADVLSTMSIPFLTPGRTVSIILAIGWFLICFLTYFGSTRWLEGGEKTGILSLFFFILWFVASLATVIAFIANVLIKGGAATINLDLLLDQFFLAMPFAVGPTVAALLGVSNKASS